MKDENKTKTQLIAELQALREQTESNQDASLEAQRKSEEELRLITENTSDNIALVTFDLKAVYTYINPSVKYLLGYNPEDLLGKSFFDFIHPDDKKELFPLLKKYVQQKIKKLLTEKKSAISETIEFRFKDKAGSWHSMQSTINIVGKQLLSVTRDISESKRAAEALRKSEAMLSKSQEIAHIGSWELDLNTNRLTWSSEVYRIFGLKPNEFEVSYEAFLEAVHPDDRAKVDAAYSDSVQAGKDSFEIEHRVIQNNTDEIRYLHEKCVHIRDAAGSIIRSIGMVQDITEHKWAEEQLVNSEEKLKIIFEFAPDALYISDLSGTFLDGNKTAEKLLGYKKEELIGKNFTKLNLLQLKDLPRAAKSLAKNLLGQSTGPEEFTLNRKDGSTVPVEIRTYPVKIKNKTVAIGIAREITARKQAEEAVRKSEQKYRLLTTNTLDTVWTTDTEFNMTFVNSAIFNFLGYTPEEFLGLNPSVFTPPEGLKTIQSAAEQLISKYKEEEISQVKFELQQIRKDGSIIDVEIRSNLLLDGEGSFIGFQGRSVDITERKLVEKKLLENENKMRSIVEGTPNLFFYTQDLNADLTYISPAVERITGRSIKDWLAQRDWFLTDTKFNEIVKETTRKHLRGETTKGPMIAEIEHKDGHHLLLEIYENIIFEDGKVVGLQGVAHDVTQRYQAEEENVKLETQLRRAQKLETIGTLAGGIAHDFNNILAPIMGFTELALLKVDESKPIARDLNQVLNGAHRAKELVEQILLFSKQTEKEHQPLALQRVIKEALKLLRPSIPTTIEISQKIDASCNKVLADATQIHQIVVNLCTNAWQSMGNGGTLTIELSQVNVDITTAKLYPNLNRAEYARLSVIDTGCGMDEETIDRIFEPFFTTKSVDKGTGLGLSVVHGIVRSHHGDILVSSEPEKGSAFHVYLPILKSEDEIVETKTKEISGGTEYVMIVDDEPAISEMVKSMLENFGYKADIYKTGLAAIEAFEQQPDKYDLLLSDLTMPQMTGLDLADQLHKKNPKLPVIIMTGFGDSLTVPTLEHYGIKRVIAKPVGVKELATTVRKVLDK